MKINKLLYVIFFILIFIREFSFGTIIKKYNEKIHIHENGDALIEVLLILKADSLNTINLPLNYKKCENLKLLENNPYRISISGINGSRFITIDFGAELHDSLLMHYSFTVPGYYDFKNVEETDFGNLTHQYRFVNTTYNIINTFSAEIILPKKYLITSIESSYPKLTEKSTIAPYELSITENKYSAIIKSSNLKIGDYSSIQFRFKLAEKSKLLLFVLLGISVLYLIFYRDILKDEKA